MQKLTKKQRFILLLVLILGLSACDGIFPQNELIVTDKFEGVIFAQEDEDHWTPSRAEVCCSVSLRVRNIGYIVVARIAFM
ncbi:MAG: hypothetical protein BroJett011_46980 [Chloroflexota bacterium]|nr:MAG: hypothetical protein BroJett011_46980 [Chloroflexota bacterium]